MHNLCKMQDANAKGHADQPVPVIVTEPVKEAALIRVKTRVRILVEAHARRIVQLDAGRLAKVVVPAAVILVAQADSTFYHKFLRFYE